MRSPSTLLIHYLQKTPTMKLPLLLLLPMLLAGPVAAGVAPSTQGGAIAAPAGPAATPPDGGFAALDANHDGVLSRDEMRQHPKSAHMAMVDENGDGVLSPAEFAELADM